LETEEDKVMGRRRLRVCITGHKESILVEFCVCGAAFWRNFQVWISRQQHLKFEFLSYGEHTVFILQIPALQYYLGVDMLLVLRMIW